MLRTVHLLGALSKVCPDPVELDADDVRVLFSGLEANFPGFKDTLRESDRFALALKRGDELTYMRQEDLGWRFGAADELYLATDERGSGAEVAVIVAAYAGAVGTTAYAVAYAVTYIAVNIAIAYALGRISMALADQPTSSGNSVDENRSYLFDQPVNLEGQGHPVPLLYGRFKCGSIVISAEVTSEKSAIPIGDGVQIEHTETRTGNVFDNDVDGSLLTLTRFEVDGTPYAPGVTRSTPTYNLTINSSGTYTLVGKGAGEASFQAIYYATVNLTDQVVSSVLNGSLYINPTGYWESTGP